MSRREHSPATRRAPRLAAQFALVAALVVAAAGAPAAWAVAAAGVPDDEPAFDRAEAGERTLRHLVELIEINTANSDDHDPDDPRPNGNELETARWFEAQLEDVDGVETHVLESAPGRANFVAILRASSPRRRPVLVMGHMDVVGADPERWQTPPFEATVRDGFVHGRGAIDCKGPLAAALTAFLELASERKRLKRDVVLLATAAEEGGPSIGIDWMLEHQRELLGDVEFALNEGGRVRLHESGEVASVNVQVTEKLGYNIHAEATGPSGHGSVPLPDNALAALARAVAAVHELRLPVHMDETTRRFFELSAGVEDDPELAAAMRVVAAGNPGEAAFDAAAERLSEEATYNAILRTAQSLTRLDGGFRNNVIPSTGTAVFNTRVLPGDDVLAVVAAFEAADGEPSVSWHLSGKPRQPPPASPVDTDLYRAMERAAAAMAPDAVVIPFLSTGGTDGAALRAAGIPTYGILPIPLLLEDELRMHGDDERAPVEGLGWAAEYLWRILRDVAM